MTHITSIWANEGNQIEEFNEEKLQLSEMRIRGFEFYLHLALLKDEDFVFLTRLGLKIKSGSELDINIRSIYVCANGNSNW